MIGRRAGAPRPVREAHHLALYNRATALVTGVEGRDFNSGFKAMRRRPTASSSTASCTAIPVLAQWRASWPPRSTSSTTSGATARRSSAGPLRRGFLDLIVKFLTTYTAGRSTSAGSAC